MLYPTINELTKGKINRYSLVIATAKGARHITNVINAEREAIENDRESDRFFKEAKSESLLELSNDKAVSVSVARIYNGEYKIIVPDECKPTEN